MNKQKNPKVTSKSPKKTKTKTLPEPISAVDGHLFDRVVSILEQARSNVVRAVNTNMVQAYWLIGREIVEQMQRGEERAKYGEKVIETLSRQLTERYGQGFSGTTLQYFRKFYLTYADRYPSIPRPLGVELRLEAKSRPAGVESDTIESGFRALDNKISQGFLHNCPGHITEP